MDGYVMGFVAVMGFMLIVTIAALVFLSIESGEGPQDTRISSYHAVRSIDTNTIETVDASGEVQRWQRSA